MEFRERPNATGREKFGFVQQETQYPFELATVRERKLPSEAFLCLRNFDAPPDIGIIVDKPSRASLEAGGRRSTIVWSNVSTARSGINPTSEPNSSPFGAADITSRDADIRATFGPWSLSRKRSLMCTHALTRMSIVFNRI